MKKCPYCAEEIKDEAIRCRYCWSDLPATTTGPTVPTGTTSKRAPTFTHSGKRFLLGYAPDYYGIWDRLAPGPPVQRYALNDDGWRHAWLQFVAWEPAPVPVRSPSRSAS